ncbi:hypothetical protein [Flavivirga rizhaonensis]|uniref:Uncharacterized protein n=1 Tax=Flavivirga rizhaonensis TaxID=2559571 RepID=A0A4V3P520_9FLAO|nr:hypothetical protein [Flavivirga rizhaonensis]TGV03584.1 hypothetical protein EM932_06030 [Flavivirga rizhaonensis]
MSQALNKNISIKLKEALADLSVDIFGYEKKISNNIINHTRKVAAREKIIPEQLYVRLFQQNDKLRAFLYRQNRPIRAIAVDELVDFFLDQGASTFLDVQNKITVSIKEYLKDFSAANKVYKEDTKIWINVKDDLVVIRAFNNSKFIKEISLSSLIKYFK